MAFIRKSSLLFLLVILLSGSIYSQARNAAPRVDPPFWWVGMHDPSVELLLTGKDIADFTPQLNYPGVTISKVIPLENPNNLIVEITLAAEAQPGILNLEFQGKKGNMSLSYPLKARNRNPNTIAGVDASDFIYLIMPDRFANGDPKNDIVAGTNEAHINRDSMFHRHGGDLQGILNHLDYVENLGVTAVWLNPVQENDQPEESYHGYAITDHYKIDPRFGDNALYRQFADDCHRRGLKVVMDMVYNHFGNEHYLYRDGLPAQSWVHQHEGFVKTSYRAPTLMDPYASKYDRDIFRNGWFDHHMPDLNQEDPHLATYLIQNSIWWIEFAGLDGFRIDTYAYADQDFMRDLLQAVQREYPTFGIFGETWVHGNGVQTYFVDNAIDDKNNSALPGVTDFQLYYAINDALTREMGWTEGISRMYFTLAKDYMYRDPLKNVLFLDNHDLSRFYSVVGEDFKKFKMGIAWLLTMRGIPQIYYGTEILMKNFAAPDGLVRSDFPGGWKKDRKNKFGAKERTEQENEAFDYIKKLAHYRKNHPVLHGGKLMQFVPEIGVYVYFRYNENETVMVVMNCTAEMKALDMKRFAERVSDGKMKDVMTDKVYAVSQPLTVPAWTTFVLEIQP